MLTFKQTTTTTTKHASMMLSNSNLGKIIKHQYQNSSQKMIHFPPHENEEHGAVKLVIKTIFT